MTQQCEPGGPFCEAMTDAIVGVNNERAGLNLMLLHRGHETGPGERFNAVALRFGKKKTEARWVSFCPFCGSNIDKSSEAWRVGEEIRTESGFTTVYKKPGATEVEVNYDI